MGRSTNTGAVGFHQYYTELFSDRWPELCAAMQAPATHTAVPGPLLQPYWLDPASVAVAELLPLWGGAAGGAASDSEDGGAGGGAPAAEILDLCAAPGGKSLVLAMRLAALWGAAGAAGAAGAPALAFTTSLAVPARATLDRAPAPRPLLICNERSARRRQRLTTVLDTHLPPDVRRQVRIYGHDATRWGMYRPESADAVLVDVPCSSEAHLLNDPGELEKWSGSRIRRNGMTQYAILASAVDSTRPGGTILYATCALTPEENDQIIRRTLARRGDKVEPIPIAELIATAQLSQGSRIVLEAAEPTTYGLHILPDRAAGAGPMYCAALCRL